MTDDRPPGSTARSVSGPTLPIPESVPWERQTLRLAPERLDALAPWATDTALAAAVRVRDPDGRIALVSNEWSDGWIPPGGAVESDESPATAAAREAREETGLDPTVGEPLVAIAQSYVDVTTGSHRFDATYLLYDGVTDGTIPPVEQLGVYEGEIEAARWFDGLPERLHDDELLRSYLRVE